MRKLKIDKKKKSKVEIAYIAVVGSFNTPNPHSSPLADFFTSDFSFLILPDIISDNTPVFFFIEYSKFSSSSYIVSLYPSYWTL